MEDTPKQESTPKQYGYDQGQLERGIKELIFDRDARFTLQELIEIFKKEFPDVSPTEIFISRDDHGETLTAAVSSAE